MSMHSSLKVDKNASTRTVRKRWERLKDLKKKIQKGNAPENQLKGYGLPKERIITKVKKVKDTKDENQSTDLTTLTS